MSEAFEEFYLNLIKKAEQDSTKCGVGVYKTGFYCNNHVILKSTKSLFHPAEYIKKLTALKDYGVNIALPKFFTSQDKVEKFGDPETFYEVQEEAKGSFVNVSNTKNLYYHLTAFNPNLNEEETNKIKLKEQYNLEMAKHRAKTGLPHLKKFVSDYFMLRTFGNGDMHTENVNYSSTNGYTFFDITALININPAFDIASQFQDQLESQTINSSSRLLNLSFQATKFELFMEECFGLGMINNFPIALKESLIDYYFSQFVYNGILTHQLLETLNNSFVNDSNPLLRIGKDISHYIKTHDGFFENNIFAMHPNDILMLEEGLINNNSLLLNQIKTKYKLNENFDFSCIDIPNFLETMKITHEFDFSNPTSSQAPTSSNVDHIKVSAIDEKNFDFEMV